MTEFRTEVVRIGAIEKHPNADTLSITQVHGGYPVIFRTGDFHEGDLAVYVPIDAVVPANDNEGRFEFLGSQRRIKAKRLRGVFSMGLLTPARDGWSEGDNVGDALGIVKWEPPIEAIERSAGRALASTPSIDTEVGVHAAPGYTDIEGMRRWGGVIREGELVTVTEKIHGANARYVWRDGRLYVGSRTRWIKLDATTAWNRVAMMLDLESKLAKVPGVAFYGELYGSGVQDLTYGAQPGELAFRVFDAYDIESRRYVDHMTTLELARILCLPVVPELYRGPWVESLLPERNGTTTLGGGHTREGFVVKPLIERHDNRLGRVILKMVGEDYLLRKSA